ncbi:hypothetical protein B7R22_11685 [Subtercola boreus]|uniref:Uncharacterized protein n=1 Tax=Subtercola boreus TaxID=120213 RepID=A0A3E0VVM4_9MICO|nr:SIR2 family protein [Subtercola boreus]RFA13750.1 hypothetical protein B7R22_11685 [Subtercola boreus]
MESETGKMQGANRLTVEELRDIVQDANLNFLLGAGASADLLKPLGAVEDWLTQLSRDEATARSRLDRVRASVYAYFFEGVIAPNQNILAEDSDADAVLQSYRKFLRTVNTLLVRRRSSILDKQVNLFTTNVDVAVEVAAEELQLELNDGFSGRYLPLFSTSNFGTVKSRRSLQYDNLSEVPTFNLLKLHGSTSWATRAIDSGGESKNIITFDSDRERIEAIEEELTNATEALYEIDRATDIDILLTATSDPDDDYDEATLADFMTAYEELAIVNPNKDKFSVTVLNQNYYDLLRLFSNSLEKENSVLFIIGFSCRDEHIRELIIRAARTNPTLQVIVFAYLPGEVQALKDRLDADLASNGNILVVGPPETDDEAEQDKYSLRRITEIFFEPLLPKPPRRPDSVVDVRLKLAQPLELDGDE